MGLPAIIPTQTSKLITGSNFRDLSNLYPSFFSHTDYKTTTNKHRFKNGICGDVFSVSLEWDDKYTLKIGTGSVYVNGVFFNITSETKIDVRNINNYFDLEYFNFRTLTSAYFYVLAKYDKLNSDSKLEFGLWFDKRLINQETTDYLLIGVIRCFVTLKGVGTRFNDINDGLYDYDPENSQMDRQYISFWDYYRPGNATIDGGIFVLGRTIKPVPDTSTLVGFGTKFSYNFGQLV